jgi:hypothetical protein
MNAAAWIALGSAVFLLLMNLVALTRYMTELRSAQREERIRNDGVTDHLKAQIKGEFDVIRTELKALLESTNVKLGQMNTDHSRLERQSDMRLRDLERIVGRSTNLREHED